MSKSDILRKDLESKSILKVGGAFDAMSAKSCGYTVLKIKSKAKLKHTLNKLKNLRGPIMILVKVEASKKISSRVQLSPLEIKRRFMKSI